MFRNSALTSVSGIAVSAVLAASLLLLATPAAAADSVSAQFDPSVLGTAAPFAALSGAAITAPASNIEGNIGALAAITEDDLTVAEEPQSETVTTKALADLGQAYDDLKSLPSVELSSADLGDISTLTPGVYHSSAALAVTSDLTFDAQEDSDAIFVIQTDAAMNTTASTHMHLAGGAKASNIFWVVSAASTLGASSSFLGSILSYAAITVGAETIVTGRTLSLYAAVTLDANTINAPTSGA